MPPYQPITPPSFSAPSVDPAMQSRMRPGTQIMEKDLQRRGGSLGSKYAPQKTAQIGGTRARLKRYGGYNVGDDGSVNEARSKNGQAGQAYRESFQEGISGANARGIQESSFAAKTVGQAWGRLSQEAQDIVTQHAVSFNQILMSEGAEFDEINTGLSQLYGDEAQWMLDNPPPLPQEAQPQPSPSSAPAGIAPGAMSPGFRQVGGGNVATSYRKNDLTPANRQKLLRQFPGYTIAISGDGRVVMKKAA
jgi:hypothetical protein